MWRNRCTSRDIQCNSKQSIRCGLSFMHLRGIFVRSRNKSDESSVELYLFTIAYFKLHLRGIFVRSRNKSDEWSVELYLFTIAYFKLHLRGMIVRSRKSQALSFILSFAVFYYRVYNNNTHCTRQAFDIELECMEHACSVMALLMSHTHWRLHTVVSRRILLSRR